MNDRIKYIASIQLYLENQLIKYTPRVIGSLSKEAFDLYIAKKKIIEEITELINEPYFNQEKFEKFIKEKLEIAEKSLKSPESFLKKPELEFKIELFKEILSI